MYPRNVHYRGLARKGTARKGPGGPQWPRGPTRAHGVPPGPGPQGPGPQGPRRAHKGPGGPTRALPTRAKGGPHGPRGSHKGPVSYVIAYDIFIHLYIYIYMTGNMGARALVPPSDRYPGARGYLFCVGGCFIGKKVQGSPWSDGSQQTGSSSAIESFWRCIFDGIWMFL